MQRALASVAIMPLLLACGCGLEAEYLGVQYDRIQGPTISGGVYVETGSKPLITMCVEAGEGGGELSMGYGDGGLIGNTYFAWGLFPKVSVLQTWNDPIRAEPNQTYIGVGLDIMLYTFIYATVSHYWHIAGSDDEHQNIWSVGVGLQFSIWQPNH